jgi:hypothetical protein
METLVTILGVALVIFLALVVYGTIARNKWGINFRPVTCPNCGAEMPRVRAPASGTQALWGGHTCAKCGCVMDKWGRRLAA